MDDALYRRLHIVALYLSLVTAIAGFAVIVVTVRTNTQAVRANVQHGMLTHITDLDKAILEHPSVYPYIRDNKTIEPGDSHYTEAVAIAELYADVMDALLDQQQHFRDQWDDSDAWDAWINEQVKNSPILRKFVLDHKTWYGHDLVDKVAMEPRTPGR